MLFHNDRWCLNTCRLQVGVYRERGGEFLLYISNELIIDDINMSSEPWWVQSSSYWDINSISVPRTEAENNLGSFDLPF